MVAATVHFYGFWPFSVNIAGFTAVRRRPSTPDLTGTFDRVYDTFVARGVPVIIGEYGAARLRPQHPASSSRARCCKFFEYLGYYAKRATSPR